MEWVFDYVYNDNICSEESSIKIDRFLYRNELYREIINRLYKSKYEVYIVGGFIRDFLTHNKFSEDVDFVTNATPEELKKLFYDMKFATGGETFLVSFVNGVEIATYRRDVVNTGIRTDCQVERAKSIEEDLSRRDFTINAIAFSPITGEFIDPYRGKSDIHDRIIKFIGDPKDRIYEDNERILRACRFMAVMEGLFDRLTFLALKKYSTLIKCVAPERISLEIKKAMKIRKASVFFETMKLIGCLKYVFPSLRACHDQDGGPHHDETIFEHNMISGDTIHPKYPLIKLAGYLHDVGKPPCAIIDDKDYTLKFIEHEKVGADLVRDELKALCFSNDEIKYICGLIYCHMNSFSKKLSKKATKRFLVRLSKSGIDYRDWFRLFIADKHGNMKSRDFKLGELKSFLEKIKYLYENENTFSLDALSINGNDVMNALSISQGPKVGIVLKKCFEYCLDNPGDNNKEFLLNFIKEIDYES